MDVDYFRGSGHMNELDLDFERLKVLNPDPSSQCSIEDGQSRFSTMIAAVAPHLPNLFFEDHPELPLSSAVSMALQNIQSPASLNGCLSPISIQTSFGSLWSAVQPAIIGQYL